eukprot:6690311-Karenia_brevis.AAC.1
MFSDCRAAWPVHPDVMSFIVNGYLRGWGLSGANVDLDVGTALFARRTDVHRWNTQCVAQIESKHGEDCDAVDVYGYDPTTLHDSEETYKSKRV